MKNVVFWTGVKDNKPNIVKKYGGYDWMDISKKSWEYWCKHNDCIFYHYETPAEKDLKQFRVTWQRWFDVYDELEKNNIEYDQIFLVDACSIVKWDCPNFFELTDNRMTAWLDKDNWGWIYQSVTGYRNFFKQFNCNISNRELVNNYINAGAVIINRTHRDIFASLKEFYYKHKTELLDLQDNTVKKGTDQTPFNYWLQINGVEINTSLPFMFNLTHIHRKNMFIHNWQLEDVIPYFIKYGYIWKYNGLPKDSRSELMGQTWDIVGHFYINNNNINELINTVPDKHLHNKTTSKKFKEDLFNYYSNESDIDSSNSTILELGTNHGHTTRILAAVFGKVITFDKFQENLDKAYMFNYNFTNINYHKVNVYWEDWPDTDFDVIFIDCSHQYADVKHDIATALKISKQKGTRLHLVFDDYGSLLSVNMAVDEAIQAGEIEIIKNIGHEAGTDWPTREDHYLRHSEGVICIRKED